MPDDVAGTGRAGIVLGAMYLGTRQDEATSFALLDRFVEGGGRWVDTADAYAFWADPSGLGGAGERMIGAWLAARPGVRDRVSISTKVRWAPTRAHDWPGSAAGLSGPAIRTAVAACLDRLGTDRIDLLWAHGEDRDVPLEETVRTFGELAAARTVGRLGASNHAAWRVERGRRLARDAGVPGWTAIQLRRSYAQPRPGAELPDDGHVIASDEALDHAAAEGLAVWGYTPLVNGAYTRADRPFPEAYDHPGTARRLAALGEVATATGATRNQVVLAWLLGGRPAVQPIVGVSTVAQLDEALAAGDLTLTDEHRELLDSAA